MNTTYRNRIHICRFYTPPKVKEGVWILVDRLWPRGIKKEALAFVKTGLTEEEYLETGVDPKSEREKNTFRRI